MVETKTHITSNFYKHVLAQWFWNADIYNTWEKNSKWKSIIDPNNNSINKTVAATSRSFNWMLEYNLGQRENIVEYWYGTYYSMLAANLYLFLVHTIHYYCTCDEL